MSKKGKHVAEGAKKSKAKQKEISKDGATSSAAVKPAFDFDTGADEEKKRSKKLKIVAIVFAILIALLAITYFAGVAVFSQIYLPQTKISSLDISLKSPEEVASHLSKDFENFNVHVKGADLDFQVDANNSKITADTQAIAIGALKDTNIWMWPFEALKMRDLSDFVSNNINEGSLAKVVKEKVDEANKNKVPTTDAHIIWNEGKSSFVVENETFGTVLDSAKVKNAIIDAIVAMSNSVEIGSSECVKPSIYHDDKRFDDVITEANKLAGANFKIMMKNTEAASIDGQTIQKWINVSGDFKVSFDEEAARQWASAIADGCNTVGSQRTYTRPDGKVIKVSGGTYGWAADGSGLADQVINNIRSGSKQNIEVAATQVAAVLAKKGEQDWPKRYVDVDLSEQHARFYDNDGKLIWESDIVSGSPKDGDATPEGVYSINKKESPSRLKGPMTSSGKAAWDSWVKYWMPFVGNMVGLHDATWQSAFGGTRYKNGYGSHGCVNLPLKAAGALYEIINEGDVVVSHS